MATIVNNPPLAQETDNGSGFLIGTILIIAFIAIIFYFGLPVLQNTAPAVQPTEINNIVPPPQPAPRPHPFARRR